MMNHLESKVWRRPFATSVRLGLAVFITAVCWMLVTTQVAFAQDPNTFFVNSTVDAVDLFPGDGICDANAREEVTSCTLRAAIMEANALGGAQTIRLPVATYQLSIPGKDEVNSTTGDLNIKGDLTIIGGQNGTRARAIIDANGLGDRVLSLSANFTVSSTFALSVTLQNLVIRGGDARTSEGDRAGGGIFVGSNIQLLIENSALVNNSAGFGGGISISSVSLLRARNLQVVNNLAEDEGGGGIFVQEGALILNKVTISGNQATHGGGILAFRARANQPKFRIQISQSTLSGNRATIEGGGMNIQDGNVTTFIASTISGNSAPRGGGIFVRERLRIAETTITQNNPDGVHTQSNVTGSNNILANNAFQDCRFESGELVIDGSGNLSGGLSCRFAPLSPNETPNLVNVNPLLGPLRFNGGTTRTHALLPNSPAINAGGTSCPRPDQRDVTRPQGARCDIGAFEAPGTVAIGTNVVTPTTISVTAGETTTLSLTWTHPVRWRDLNTVDLMIEDDETRPLFLRFSEGITDTSGVSLTNSLLLLDGNGDIVGAAEVGAGGTLESESVQIDLGQSTVTGSGEAGQSVTLTLALAFKPEASGKVYRLSLMASDDAGVIQGPEEVGTVSVGPFDLYLPVVVR